MGRAYILGRMVDAMRESTSQISRVAMEHTCGPMVANTLVNGSRENSMVKALLHRPAAWRKTDIGRMDNVSAGYPASD